ncbi:unnamed protein product [Ectocarpus sp. CCAP 1310/34]|nr:unnamed protein product [Ectocarpus sp. CCAP 1310/34]
MFAARCALRLRHCEGGGGARVGKIQDEGSHGDKVPDSTSDVGAGDDFGGAGDDSRSADGREDDEKCADGGLEDLLARIEESLGVSGEGTGTENEGTVEAGGDMDSGGEEGDIGLDDERYDDFQGNVDNRGTDGTPEVVLPPEVFLPPGQNGGASSAPRLNWLHTMTPSYASSKTVEGGADKLRENTRAGRSPFDPFRTKEQQLLFVWQHVHRISQRALGGLLEVLLMQYEGEPFDVRGLAGVDPEHFYDRMRTYLPLLELLERDVPSIHDGTTSSVVYDLPVNLLLERVMQIPSETVLSEAYPGWELLRGEEAAANSLTSDHINCVATRREGNVVNSNHNGTLARSTPFFGLTAYEQECEGGRCTSPTLVFARSSEWLTYAEIWRSSTMENVGWC